MKLFYRVFGGNAGQSMLDLSKLKTARHTKGDSEGKKAERPQVVEVPIRMFQIVSGVAALSDFLFGAPSGKSSD